MAGMKEQMGKLNFLVKEADGAFSGGDVTARIGACTIYAGIMELLTIQAAKLMEQIILKSQLHKGKNVAFTPHDDSFFYGEKVGTRRILIAISETLPFRASGKTREEDAAKINGLAKRFIDSGHGFLDLRNTLIHHMGNPEKNLGDIENSCLRIKESFEKFSAAQKEFVLAAQPFRTIG
ncbi:hypothetical protein H0O02_01345 [Candidatus Micrarchaeota archaeon]|nr:hypothetical protein [Candidatus Micrarchaeota archaeon]